MYLALTLLLLASGIVNAKNPSLDREWQLFKHAFGKTYPSADEEFARRLIWEANRDKVQRHNRDEQASFKMAVNQFADMMPMEMNKGRLHVQSAVLSAPAEKLTGLPPAWDWRTEGVVSPVHDQGQLGDALAFVATDAVESSLAIDDQKMVTLSYPEFHDCCSEETLLPFGCMKDKMNGICSLADYPSTMGSCNPSSCNATVKICGQGRVSAGNESALQLAVLIQPILVLIDASHSSFQLYMSGVYYEPNCSQLNVDHVVLLVGYGTMGGQDYWIAKNSWGTSWGMQGYVLLSRNRSNNCGVASYATFPVLCPSK